MKTWNRMLAVSLAALTAFSPLSQPMQADASGHAAAWAEESIQEMQQRGIMKGDAKGQFRPLDHLTRQEFAAIIANALNVNLTDETLTSPFVDVMQGSWAEKPIAALDKLGILQGDGKGHYRPNDPITREEIAVLLARAAGVKPAGGAGSDLAFTDQQQISPWAREAVQFWSQAGVIQGDGQQFGPKRHALRQEIAVMLSKALPFFQAHTATVDRMEDGKVIIDGKSYQVTESLAPLFTSGNQSILEGAKMRFVAVDQTISKITYLELTQSGQVPQLGQAEFSGNRVLDAGHVTLDGDLSIQGDFISVKNVNVQGNLEIQKSVQHDFYASNLKVMGQTVINGGDSHTVVFEDSKLGQVEINKPQVRVAPRGQTTVGDLSVNVNAAITADSQITLPKLTVQEGVQQLELHANIGVLEVRGQQQTQLSGSGQIKQLNVMGSGNLVLNNTGTIEQIQVADTRSKLTLNTGLTVNNLRLPEGTKTADAVTNYARVKDNIKSTNGTSPPPTGGGGGGGGGGSTNYAPQSKTIPVQTLGLSSQPITFEASDLATDANGDTLVLVADSIKMDKQGIVEAIIEQNGLVLKPKGLGEVVVKALVSDGKLEKEISISVQVTQAEELQATVLSGGSFAVGKATHPLVIEVEKLDVFGQKVTDLDLSGLSILNGTTKLTKGYSLDETTNEVQFSVSYLNMLSEGEHTLTLRLGTSQTSFTLQVLPAHQHAPVAKSQPKQRLLLGHPAGSYEPSDLASDEDGDALHFVAGSLTSSDEDIVEAQLEAGSLHVTSKSLGETTLSLRVSDGHAEVQVELPIQVVQSQALLVHPFYGNRFAVQESGIEAFFTLSLINEFGQQAAVTDYSQIQISNGSSFLQMDRDYTVVQQTYGLALESSFLNQLSAGETVLSVTYHDVTGELPLIVQSESMFSQAVEAVNAATSMEDTRAALESPALRLALVPYQSITDSQRNIVAQAVLVGKETGYLSRWAIQDAVDLAITQIQWDGDEVSAIRAVNQAQTVQEMLDAIKSPYLQLDNPDYSYLEEYEREIVAQYLLEQRGTGYSSREAIQEAFDLIIAMILEDWYALMDDIRATEIGFAEGDYDQHVTKDIVLPTEGAIHGSTITWTSDRPEVITAEGHVFLPSEDTEVILSALFTNRYEKYELYFPLLVKAFQKGIIATPFQGRQLLEGSAATETLIYVEQYDQDHRNVEDPVLTDFTLRNDSSLLRRDIDYTTDEAMNEFALQMSYLNALPVGMHVVYIEDGYSTDAVTLDILPMEESVAAAVYAVNEAADIASLRLAIESEDLALQLIPYYSLSDAQQQSVAQAVYSSRGTEVWNRWMIQDLVDMAVRGIYGNGSEASAVKAVNEATTVPEMLGAIKSPYLHLDHEYYSAMEDYELEIIGQYLIEHKPYHDRDHIQSTFALIIDMIVEDWYAILDDAYSLEIGFTPGDSAESVTGDVYLPSIGSIHGAKITWTSDQSDIIGLDGHVTRPVADTVVSLTAYLTNRYEKYMREFKLLVKGTEPSGDSTLPDMQQPITDLQTARNRFTSTSE
ncbi:S-layer homology domain-containing protein [Ammoniphilus sp. CFH 90114]|uniref:S-layer homology domain-containing protein n=1 Tax=Ammoniphilus sp. CFH 90114 TaxID=2493665 RepID=UPI00100FD5AB|nr:S-layer homology domain-containing protein [Ammoniphilus sp. CFH 90114]RXT03687.1 S-layer homology domain-containing protein [Ammoniphilus sp. CFH 90114]